MHHMSWRNTSIIATIALAMLGIVISLSIAPTPSVSAQAEEPTATPRDPIWLGFSVARDAIQEEKGVNLQVVQKWEFWQDNWDAPNAQHPEQAAGIDSCLSTTFINSAREIYWGWTFVITDLRGTVHEARVSFDLQDYVVCDIQTVLASAPAAAEGGDATNPDLPAPVAGAGATGSFELGGHISGLSAPALDAIQRSGMTWFKVQIPMSAGAGAAINYVNEGQANGLKVLIGTVGDKEQIGSNYEAYSDQFAAFVAEIAAAGADAIEIWNEPNIDREWPTGQISGAAYTNLLAKSFNAIKSANPNTIVISGAPAPTGFFGLTPCAESAGGCSDDIFLQEMAAAGAANYMDCVGAHYNEGVMPPSAFSGDPRGEYPTYYFGSMTNRAGANFPGKPICYTELGYLSGEGMGAAIPPGFNWSPDDPVTVAEHAAYLADAAARAAQRGDVRMLIVWNVNFTRWDSDPMGGYAIIRPDGTCPACDALGTVMGG